MKINAQLDFSVVAHETGDELSVLIELEAPAAPANLQRPQASLEVVLDRSGSMSGPPLDGAKRALIALVRRLEPTDHFGLVTFDESAQVVVPAGPLRDKEAVIRAIEGVQTGGSTDLSAGYVRGLRELRRVASKGGTLLLISDGHVNAGIQSVEEFASIAGKARADGIITSTIGYGSGYDETLLAALARDGSGNHVFADNPDSAGAAVAGEVDGLLNKVIQGLALTVAFEPEVTFLRLFNDLPAQELAPRTIMIELGDLYADESRKLLLAFTVPALESLGLFRVASLELSYVELPGLVEHTATVPLTVNVVPGDQAAGRVPNPTVRTERYFQDAQDAKRRASEAFEQGDLDGGKRLLGEATAVLGRTLPIAPDELKAEIAAEMDEIQQMDARAEFVGTQLTSKLTRASFHQGNRKRGRTQQMATADQDEFDEPSDAAS
jgi:Ca-activated chloride channel homolog